MFQIKKAKHQVFYLNTIGILFKIDTKKKNVDESQINQDQDFVFFFWFTIWHYREWLRSGNFLIYDLTVSISIVQKEKKNLKSIVNGQCYSINLQWKSLKKFEQQNKIYFFFYFDILIIRFIDCHTINIYLFKQLNIIFVTRSEINLNAFSQSPAAIPSIKKKWWIQRIQLFC